MRRLGVVSVDEVNFGGTEVLTGQHGDLRWRVLVRGDEQELFTMIQVHQGPHRVVAGSGFGGLPLFPGQLIHDWAGRTDDLPYFVMTRSDPVIDRVVAITDHGTEIELSISPVIPRYKLRFAAAGLPDGEAPSRLRAEREGTVIADLDRRMPPRFFPPPG